MLLNRRDFLSESALLTSAGAVLARAPVVAAETKPAKNLASDTLRVAVVGVKGRGMSHVAGFNGEHNCVITTVCDADKGVIGNAMKAISQKTGKEPKFEQDIRKVVEDKNIDVISIATPNHWHALMAIWAMQNGKHVYVEKPVSHNVREGRLMVDAARHFKRVCQTGTQSRSMPGMRDAVAYIHDGKIGKVELAKGLCFKLRPSIGKVTEPGKVPASCDYDLWCGPAPKRPLMRAKLHYDWHWVWDTGNGDLGNQGIHEMDKARWGLKKDTLPRAVRSVGGRFGYVDDGETCNTQVIDFDYGDSRLVFEVRGWPSQSPFPGKHSPKTPRKGEKPTNFVGNIWYGSQGLVVCPSYSGGVAYGNDGEVLATFTTPRGIGDNEHFKNFVEAIRDGKPLTADIEQGHLSSAMCHLGNISHLVGSDEAFGKRERPFGERAADEAFASLVEHLGANKVQTEGANFRLGKKLTLDATKEAFVGDSAADKLLTREYRKGFEVPAKF